MLQTVENRIAMPPEIAIEAENYQFIQRLNRTVMDEYLEQRNREIDLTVQQAMLSGHLTSYYTPDRIVTPGLVMQNNHAKSAWFEHAAHLELKNPCILNFLFGKPSDEDTDEDAELEMKKNEEEVATLLQRLGQQAYMWSMSEKLTLYTAHPSRTQFLPKDISNVETQESASGLVFAPGADPGKIGKRLRAYAGAPGVFFDPRPSMFPNLNLGGDLALRIKIRDSGTVGDGGGSCPEFIAREIISLSGAPTWGDIIGFQIVALGADFSFKALINVMPNELWTDQSADLVVDAKSVNHQVHSTLATVGKLMPTRHKKNKRHFYVEPMNLGEVVNRFIDAEQLTQQAMVIAERVDRETWDHAMDRSRDLQEGSPGNARRIRRELDEKISHTECSPKGTRGEKRADSGLQRMPGKSLRTAQHHQPGGWWTGEKLGTSVEKLPQEEVHPHRDHGLRREDPPDGPRIRRSHVSPEGIHPAGLASQEARPTYRRCPIEGRHHGTQGRLRRHGRGRR